ncbi:MAG TPA: glycosyltransferase family 4 protein [Phycisphaerae bacterium]|nr:glycosyltransferase family 4 protein [Phycisphaerae bacterium]
MRWMFVTTRYPWPLANGLWLRLFNIAKELCQLGDTVAVTSFPPETEFAGMFEQSGAIFLPTDSSQRKDKGPGRYMMSPFIFEQSLAKAVDFHSPYYDVTVLAGPGTLQYSPEARKSPYVLADLIDDPILEYRRRNITSMNVKRFFQQVNFIARYPRYEQMFLEKIDMFTLVSDYDATSFKERNPATEVMVSSNGVDAEYFARPSGYVKSPSRPKVVFLGVMDNINNILAAEYLVKKILPYIVEKCPEVQIQLVGANPVEDVLALDGYNVQVTGTVDDVRPFLWSADAVCLPMVSGTGIKNKLLEAWASGTAVAATPMAVEGIDVRDGEDILVRENPKELSQAILELLYNDTLRQKLSARALLASRAFNWHMVAARLREAVCPEKYSALLDEGQ